MLIALAGTVVLFTLGWVLSGRRRDGVVPAAILGGAIGLVLRQFELLPGSVEYWQQVGYHLFGISFLAIGLTQSEDDHPVTGGAVWVGVGQGMSFAVQATVGGLVTLALIASGRDLAAAFGFLAPMGLEEGPGQAVSIGAVWESAGFADAPTLGATIASVGFVAAYGLGLVAMRGRQRRRAGASQGHDRHGDVASPATASPRSGSGVDWRRTAAPGLGVVAGYAVVYWSVWALSGLAGEGVRDTVLGMLFFIALLVGLGVRWVAGRLGLQLAPVPQRTITIAAVDGLTVAILASLAWARISAVAGPLAVVLVTTIAASIGVVAFATRQLSAHRFERALALFGTVTGTVSSGLALLSLSDPDQDTPVAVELGSSVVVSAPMVLAGVAVATAAAQGAMTLALATGVFAVAAIIAGIALVWAGRHFDTL